jgi:hypothetical protein
MYDFKEANEIRMKNLITTQVLIIGGGCSGTAAAIQSARMGVTTLLIEETPWLGGMITAAGVSAFDGNKHALGGGIYGELRKQIEDYYGGADKTYTGWISLTCFEPSVAMRFLHEMVLNEKLLTVWFETRFVETLADGDRITGAVVRTKQGELIAVRAQVVIEATEFGDVIKSAGAPYRLGRDSKSDTGEHSAPERPDDIVQDMTFCATLKKYDGAAPPVGKSMNYNENIFINATSLHATTNDESYLLHKSHDWESFISYAALPNGKYLLNWPFHSNDYPTTLEIYEQPETRAYHFERAKELTSDFVHYMQTRLGHPEWGIAEDEYPTADDLPFIPYVRESRRVKGKRLMVERDVVPQQDSYRPPLQEDSIAVGDYFLDHHHSQFFIEPAEARLKEPLPANAHFQIPLGCLIPLSKKGLIVAEKSISVSHIVNGCTRLQPVVMLIGQAAGAVAALTVMQGIDPGEVPATDVQDALLTAGCQLFPYIDIWNTDPDFKLIQKAALRGIFPDEKDFSFHPHKLITAVEIKRWSELVGIPSVANKVSEDSSRIQYVRAMAGLIDDHFFRRPHS